MAAAIALREDFDGPGLRKLAKGTKNAVQARRFWRLTRSTTAAHGRTRPGSAASPLQIVRDWVLRFNKRGPDGLINRKAPGNCPKLNEDHRQALARRVESGPIPAIHGVVR